MSRYTTSLSAEYFDQRYAADEDPWNFETSDYERAKYESTLAALPARRYAHALEVGCSIGVLTERLARRCDALVALDVAQAAVGRARARCRAHAHVSFIQGQAPADWPQGPFDLIVLSEVVYYLDRADVARLVERVRLSLAPRGDIVLVHWTGDTHYPLTGDEAADLFIANAADIALVTAQSRTDDYRLDVMQGR